MSSKWFNCERGFTLVKKLSILLEESVEIGGRFYLSYEGEEDGDNNSEKIKGIFTIGFYKGNSY